MFIARLKEISQNYEIIVFLPRILEIEGILPVIFFFSVTNVHSKRKVDNHHTLNILWVPGTGIKAKKQKKLIY